MKRAEIKTGDVMEGLAKLASDSVHCVVTSPPYWRQRDYGCDGQIGLEETLGEYIENLVVVFREVRRVLREDGTLWLNVGDTYNGSGKGGGGNSFQEINVGSLSVRGKSTWESSLKSKDLCMIPARVAIALQADGWWLRSDIIWHKPNPMPSSVTDRPTTCHEYLFLLTKSAKYYYDYVAIMEETTGNAHHRGHGVNPKAAGRNSRIYQDRDPQHSSERKIRPKQNESFSRAVNRIVSRRNKRSVWTIATQPFSDEHFATFPEKLVEPCILAGSSEVGACPECGKPWERIVEKTGGTTGKSWHDHGDDLGGGQSQGSHPGGVGAKEGREGNPYTAKHIGWKCRCKCNHPRSEAVPCVALDPFVGSGTTGVVALKHRRDFIGIELNPEYVDMAEKRMTPYLNQKELAL